MVEFTNMIENFQDGARDAILKEELNNGDVIEPRGRDVEALVEVNFDVVGRCILPQNFEPGVCGKVFEIGEGAGEDVAI
jgi:hypothetical protein